MEDRLESRIKILESNHDALQRQIDNQEMEIREIRTGLSSVKDLVGTIQLENARHFGEVKDLLNGVTSKALNSLPPWGAILTVLLGGLIGAVASSALAHFGG